MTEPLPNPRCERKFLPPAGALEDVLARIRRHPALFREAYPPRWINNLYFDTPDLRSFHDHVCGLSWRDKTRLRWYGPAGEAVVHPVLERKIKRGIVSGKLGYRLSPLSLNGGMPWAEVQQRQASSELPERLREHLRERRPVLVNRYLRRYYLSADGRLRLTVDTDLEFRDARGANGSLPRLAVAGPRIILELKYAPDHAEEAAAATQALPFRLTRCSKYVLGVEHLPAR